MSFNNILVTGATGYIGSHTVVELLNEGFNVIGIDNFSNSSPDALDRIRNITGKDLVFYEADILDQDKIEEIVNRHQPICTIHFAGKKAVGESSEIPREYYRVNVCGTLSLLAALENTKICSSLLFSSSATVYGEPAVTPIPETQPKDPKSPYARTKCMVEDILLDIHNSNPHFNVGILRYFNPAGAHPSGMLGEDPLGIPYNLMPFLAQVATGKQQLLRIFGNNYDTRDGTPIRDYIHVVDLAQGHLAAVKRLLSKKESFIYNLGTGRGSTVFEMLNAMSATVGRPLPYQVVERRPGDVRDLTADPSRAEKELDWKAKSSLSDICNDLWRWQEAISNVK